MQTTTLPTDMVTFLFAEILGDTQHGADPAQADVAGYVALMRRPIEAGKGKIIQTSGAGISSVFVSARAALEAALEIQRALLAQETERGSPPRARIALHVDVAQIFGNRYSSLALNRVARLLAIAGAGQILLTPPTQVALQHQLPANVTLIDTGEHMFPSLFKPMRIYQATSADLPGSTAPILTYTGRRSNLPPQPTRLIGRQAEVARCGDLLTRQDGPRLLNLRGPGGVGKTRLAVQVGDELLSRSYFPDGVYMVFLAEIGDAQLLPSAIARAIDVQEQPGTPLIKTLKEYLAAKHMLLILDNFEHVVEAAPLVADLLAATSSLRVLVTSQTPLGVAGEQQLTVPPLSMPAGQQLPPLEELARFEAVRLFVACAQLDKPEFELTAEHAPVVAEICRRVDGLPLGIELAAARVRHITPQALLQRLRDSLTTLEDGSAPRPARQQTLRNVFDWSYGLLEPAEQRLLRQLGVFIGGCDDAAIAAVGANPAEPGQDPLRLVGSLIDKSLVRQELDANDQPRVRVLRMIREYALEQLAEHDELDAARERHATYYLQLIEESESESGGAGQGAWLQRLEQEHGNIRAALQWARDSGATEHGLRMAAGIWKFWQLHGYVSEGSSWMTLLLERSAGSDYPSRARALWGAGWLAIFAGKMDHAREVFEEGVAYSERLGDSHSKALSLHGVGAILRNQQQHEQATAAFEESLGLFQQTGDVEHVAWTYQHLGFISLLRGDNARAVDWLEQGLVIFRQLELPWAIAEMLFLQAKALVSQRRHDEGKARLDEACGIYERLGDNGGIAKVNMLLGYMALVSGDLAQATQRCEESLRLFYQVGGYQWWLGYPLEYLGDIVAMDGQFERAALLWGAADSVREQASAPTLLDTYPDHDELVGRAQAQLGPDEYAAAVARGQAMSVDEVTGLL